MSNVMSDPPQQVEPKTIDQLVTPRFLLCLTQVLQHVLIRGHGEIVIRVVNGRARYVDETKSYNPDAE